LAQIFFLQHFKNKIIFNFVKFVDTKKGITTHFFSPLSFVPVFGSGIRDPGSRMGKNQDPKSGINIPNPQHWETDTCTDGSVADPGWVKNQDPDPGLTF
jgi:hypothetical protein